MSMSKTEAEVTPGILEAIQSHPLVARAWKQSVGRMRGNYRSGPRGMPDVDGWTHDGRRIGIEIKAPGGKSGATVEQIRTIDAMRAAGCVAGVVTSVEEAVSLLNGAR